MVVALGDDIDLTSAVLHRHWLVSPVWVCLVLASRSRVEVEEDGALPPLAGRGLHRTVVAAAVVCSPVVGDQSAGPAACRGPGVRGAGQRSHAHLSRAREGVAVVPHISWAQ